MFLDILLVVFVGLVAWLVVRLLPRGGGSGKGKHKDVPSNPFAAVSVFAAPTGCQLAKALKGKRFLSLDAPRLPLAGCDSEKCQCTYHHHTDRRTGNGDRRALGTTGSILAVQSDKNRRSGAGRRLIDKNDNLSWT